MGDVKDVAKHPCEVCSAVDGTPVEGTSACNACKKVEQYESGQVDADKESLKALALLKEYMVIADKLNVHECRLSCNQCHLHIHDTVITAKGDVVQSTECLSLAARRLIRGIKV